jgi:hypothetical protein
MLLDWNELRFAGGPADYSSVICFKGCRTLEGVMPNVWRNVRLKCDESTNAPDSAAFIGAPHGIRSPKPSETDLQIEAGKIPLIARDAAEFKQMMSLLFVERPFLPYPILHAAQSDAIQNAQSNVRL